MVHRLCPMRPSLWQGGVNWNDTPAVKVIEFTNEYLYTVMEINISKIINLYIFSCRGSGAVEGMVLDGGRPPGGR